MTKQADIIVHGASQLLTLEPTLAHGVDDDEEACALGAIRDGALAIVGDRVADVGGSERILAEHEAPLVINASGRTVTPGLVDPHTHAVFAGSRHMEFALRMRGASYLDILAAGGGIHSTVEATRRASLAELVALTRPRLARALAFGVTTMEVKSGYGLDLDNEVKMLLAVRELGASQPIRPVPTLLSAHVVPKEYEDRRTQYLDLLVTRLIPEVASRKLAAACDVFLDRGAFDLDETRAILGAARAAGLAVKVHAGQFTDMGGPELMADMKGLSADHMEHVSDEGVRRMAEAGVVATLLPGAAFCVRSAFPNGRRLADAGVPVALATDHNPGTSPTSNLPLMASMGAALMGLTCTEAMRAVTRNAACALGLEGEVGSLVPGRRADLVVFDVPDFRLFLYHFGVNHAVLVVAGGRVVLEEGS
ncbi:MAG: imidazolonepropionase [Deltaproteobacteria bacterium]|nr:imidazolonepropionase [Deltaproteobacteria bacterium]